MSDIKFTPAPWVIDTDTRPAEVCTVMHVPDSKSKGQGFVYVRGAVGYWSADENENMANAHLIAAAPDMYLALRKAMDFIESHVADPDITEEMSKAWMALEVADPYAALAKAEGKS